jgi:hypothetical protein
MKLRNYSVKRLYLKNGMNANDAMTMAKSAELSRSKKTVLDGVTVVWEQPVLPIRIYNVKRLYSKHGMNANGALTMAKNAELSRSKKTVLDGVTVV